jgi:phosphoglycerate dehydrogenase-like enzyme
MMKTLVTVSQPDLKKIAFSEKTIKKLEAISDVCWVEEGKAYSSEDLRRDIAEFDACITGWGSPKFTPEVLEKAEKLRFVGHSAGTVIPIVDIGAFEKDITVVNANSMLSRSTAEGAFALMMAGAWNLHGYNARMKDSLWSNNNKETVMGVYGNTIGLIGYGDIAKELIRLLKPFQPEILVYSNHCRVEEAENMGFRLCGLEELLMQSQIISLHNTLTPSTKGMIGKKELAKIKNGALLVNTARAAIIDEQALIEALKEDRFFAAIDVYEKEPVDKDNILLNLPNVLCTPHIAGFSGYWKSRLGESVVDDLEKWIKGEPLTGQVTIEKYRRLTPR